jgi:hypothetical protein
VDRRGIGGGGLGICDAQEVSPETDPTDVATVRAEPWKVATVPPEPPEGDLAFTCPRCRAEVAERAYGPCTSCRAELRARLGGEARDVEVEYVPKMNVTPNAVALKD